MILCKITQRSRQGVFLPKNTLGHADVTYVHPESKYFLVFTTHIKGQVTLLQTCDLPGHIFIKILIFKKGVLTSLGLRPIALSLWVPEITLGAGSARVGSVPAAALFLTDEKLWSSREGRWCGGGRARRAVWDVGGEGARTCPVREMRAGRWQEAAV